MNKKNGFTLVELLAVIVILAVILVIAVPQIINVINESKKGVLESSARLIASSAETMKISNDTLGINSEITCEDVAQLTSEDYETCKIDFINGEAKVTLVGKGKFEGMGVLLGTKDNVVVTYGLEEDDTDDHNIRYVGSNPSNYVEFGNDNELWRIIGIFNMTTASGKTEKLMKIVKNESIGNYSWDSSMGGDSAVNNGWGINQWGASTYTDGSAYYGADLMTMLNAYYIGTSTTCNYCNGGNQETCINDCSSNITQIGSTYREMIEEVVWNTGATTANSSIERRSAYNSERGTRKGNKCSSGSLCNDKVIRTTEWIGKVGLIYPSDYGYASTSCTNISESSCGSNNWLYTGSSYWTLSPVHTSSAYGVFSVNYGGAIYNTNGKAASDALGVRPSVYLKSNVSIISGEGTEQNPYKLSGN